MTDYPYSRPDKAEEIIDFMRAFTGKDLSEIMQAGDCMTCDNPNMKFRDMLSVREYEVLGMCQNCQDGVFTEP